MYIICKYIYIYTHTYSPHIFHPLFVLHGKTPYQYQLGSSHTGVPHSTNLNAQRLAVTLRHCVHVVQPHVKAAAIPGARKAAATIVVTAATPEIEGMSQQPMGNMSIYSLYIPGNPKASFFFHRSGLTRFLSLRVCWFDWRPDLKNQNTVC